MHLEAITSRQREIFNRFRNFSQFYLAGGTALALQIGHRVSKDFDFFSRKEIPADLLLKIKKIFFDFKIKIIINHVEQLSLELRGINLTFLKYPFPLIDKLKVYQGVKLISVAEIAVSKAYALGRRATYKDYVDLYFILQKRYITLERMIKLSQKKYGEEFDPRLFLEQLLFLEDVVDTEIQFLEKKVNKGELQKFFKQEIKQYGL